MTTIWGMAEAMAACTDWSSIDWKDVADTAVAADRGVSPGAKDVAADEPGTVLVEVAGELVTVDDVAWLNGQEWWL